MRRTGNGIVYDGALRDLEGLKEIGGFTSFYTSYDPSYHNPGHGQNRDLTTMIVGINRPTRIRTVTVMPGDVVLGKMGVVVFVPPHLAERVVTTSEIVRLRDMFGHQRLREGKYTAGQIDTRWSDEIEKDFSQWLNDHINELACSKGTDTRNTERSYMVNLKTSSTMNASSRRSFFKKAITAGAVFAPLRRHLEKLMRQQLIAPQNFSSCGFKDHRCNTCGYIRGQHVC